MSQGNNQLLPAMPHGPISSGPFERIIKVEDIAGMEELRKLSTKRNLAEELYRRIGPFDFEKNESRKLDEKKICVSGPDQPETEQNLDDTAHQETEPAEDLTYAQITLGKGQTYYGQVNCSTKQRQGRGTIMWDDKSTFEGFWMADKANGRGRMIFADGSIYEGNWVNGRQNGYGVFSSIEGVKYHGNWQENLQHGKGEEEWPDGTKYAGDFVKG